MRFLRLTIVLLLALVLPCTGWAAPKEDPEVSAAVASAQAWLALVDAGQYGESWDQAASLFRGSVRREQWAEMVGGVRKPLGKLVSRQVKNAQRVKQLPGVPDGDYVPIQFTTVYAKKQASVETVTVMKDKDGRWHVGGYFLK